jgi:small subunit ribosomal protein S26
LAALEETKNEAEHHQQCLKENEEWNKEVALLREQRLSQVQEARRESILAKLVAFEERQKERMEKAEQMVREEKVIIAWRLPILKYMYNKNVLRD